MKKILIVIDMQNDFIDGTLGTKEAVAIVPNVIRKIKTYQAEGEDVYFTMDTHTSEYLSTQEGKNLPVLHCIEGTKGWELADEIQSLATEIQKKTGEEIIFKKGVFGSEALAHTIREKINEGQAVAIELVGLCTDICVLANAMVLKTFMPEVPISVDAVCCAGVTPTTHSNALRAMEICQIQVTHENITM